MNSPINNIPQLEDRSPPLKSTSQKDLKVNAESDKLDMRASPLLFLLGLLLTILAKEALFVYFYMCHPSGEPKIAHEASDYAGFKALLYIA